MPTQREIELERAKKRIEDRLKARPADIESGISKTRADLLAGDVSRQQEARDILTGVGARYGVAGTQEAGVSAIGERAPEFERQRATALSFRRTQEMNQFFNQRYEYAQNQYLQAGYDLEQSRNFARQWALQQTQQAFEGEMAELGRQGALEKEKISQEFSEKGLALEEDFESRYDPYQEAAIRGLIGIAPLVGYNEYLKRQGKSKQAIESPAPNYLGTGRSYKDILQEQFSKQDLQKRIRQTGASSPSRFFDRRLLSFVR